MHLLIWVLFVIMGCVLILTIERCCSGGRSRTIPSVIMCHNLEIICIPLRQSSHQIHIYVKQCHKIAGFP